VQAKQERIIFDNRTQINADNQDFKYKELTEEIIRIFYRVYNKLSFTKKVSISLFLVITLKRDGRSGSENREKDKKRSQA
jgi:hypothetical protein